MLLQEIQGSYVKKFQNLRLKSVLQLKLKSSKFQRGRIPPQLPTDSHQGSTEYPQLHKTGRFFVLILNDHTTVYWVDLCHHMYYAEPGLAL